MSCNGGSHPRINTLGRMTRAESGPDLRYEVTYGGGGGGGGGGAWQKQFLSREMDIGVTLLVNFPLEEEQNPSFKTQTHFPLWWM